MACKIETLPNDVGEHMTLKRCMVHGIAFVEDRTLGAAHSAHPSVSSSGNPRAVYGRNARIVTCHGWAYNTDSVVVTDAQDMIAAQACHCGGEHGKPRAGGPFTIAQWRRFLVDVHDHTDPDGSLHQRSVPERWDDRLGCMTLHGSDLEAAERAYYMFSKRWGLLNEDERAQALKEAHSD